MIDQGGRVFIGLLAGALLLAACSPTPSPTGPAPSAPPGGAVIVAQGVAFDRTRVDVPANAAFPLLFENRDSVPHNITILDAGGRPLFVGETFSGYGSRTYTVPPLNAGSFGFRCDVHTYMTGTLIAGAAVVR
jgi:plastocyanin